jgi:hypothetical protein
VVERRGRGEEATVIDTWQRGRGVTSSDDCSAALVADAVLDVEDLVDLYRRRDGTRVPVHQQDLSLAERVVRTGVARHGIGRRLPLLVAELIEAAADDVGSQRSSDVEQLANADLRVIEAVELCKAVLDAVGLEALARLQGDIESNELLRRAHLGHPGPARWLDAAELAAMEVTTATGLGSHEIHSRLGLATCRTAAAAELRSRLQSGAVSLHRACTIHSETRTLPDDAALEIVDTVLREKDGAPPSPSLFRQRLSRACLAADRDAAERRREARRRRRGAYALIEPDGLGALHVTNDPYKVIAAMERDDAIARAARQGGDSRDLDSLRAEVITDLLMFGWPSTSEMPAADDPSTSSSGAAASVAAAPGSGGRFDQPRIVEDWFTRLGRHPAATVRIVVPFTTAVGATDAPCEIPGHGWVLADQARQIILNTGSTWHRLAVDVDTGAALRLETTSYRPTAAMRAHVEAVDGTCRAPGCTVPAARCDLDHDIPWPHGPTSVANLTSKHRPHHNAHTHAHWRVDRDSDGVVRWRTKAGRTYETRPKDWLDGVRDQRASAPAVVVPAADDSPPF